MDLPPYDLFPSITGNKVTLREIYSADVGDLIDISFYEGRQAKNLPEARHMQHRIHLDYMAGNSLHWGISDNRSGNLVGTCGYYRGFGKGEGELGCVLLPQFRGMGFMQPSMQMAIDFGIKRMMLKRIWAITTEENLKAISLLEKLSFKKIAHGAGEEIEYELQ